MKFLGFGIVGGIGFVIDGGILTLLSETADMNIYLARGLSFVVAVFVTWLLNRTYVFSAALVKGVERRQEYVNYFVVQVGGALLNLGIFAGIIASFPVLRTSPIIPFAISSLVAMVFNFTGARYWVFAHHASVK